MFETRPSEPLAGGDPDLARRTGPQSGVGGLLQDAALDLADRGLQFIDRAVLDGLVAEGDALSPLASAVSNAWSWTSV
jgi:hypothetical protein